jgi:hypothetical protein
MAHLKHIREWRKKQYLGVILSLLYFKPLDPIGQLPVTSAVVYAQSLTFNVLLQYNEKPRAYCNGRGG